MKRFLNILFQRGQEGTTQERLSVVNIENIDDIIVILVPLPQGEDLGGVYNYSIPLGLLDLRVFPLLKIFNP